MYDPQLESIEGIPAASTYVGFCDNETPITATERNFLSEGVFQIGNLQGYSNGSAYCKLRNPIKGEVRRARFIPESLEDHGHCN